MSKIKEIQKKIVKLDNYLISIQRILLFTVYLLIYLALVNQNKFHNKIYGISSMALLLLITLIRIFINMNTIKFIANIIKQHGKKIKKMVNIAPEDEFYALFIFINLILNTVIKSQGNSLLNFNNQGDDKQSTIKNTIKIFLLIQIIVVGFLVVISFYKLFKKKKETKFKKFINVAKDINLNEKDLNKFAKSLNNKKTFMKFFNDMKNNIFNNYMKILKNKPLSKRIRAKLKSLETMFLKEKIKQQKK